MPKAALESFVQCMLGVVMLRMSATGRSLNIPVLFCSVSGFQVGLLASKNGNTLRLRMHFCLRRDQLLRQLPHSISTRPSAKLHSH